MVLNYQTNYYSGEAGVAATTRFHSHNSSCKHTTQVEKWKKKEETTQETSQQQLWGASTMRKPRVPASGSH